MSPAERQARRFLWLFPAWLRATRGEEALTLVLDLLPVGARRLPLRSMLDLLRAGLHSRRVGTPALAVRFGVLLAANRPLTGVVAPEWRPWLRRHLQGKWQVRFVLERALVGALLAPPGIFFVSGGGSNLTSVAGRSELLGSMVLASSVASICCGFASATAGRPLEWRARVLERNGLLDVAGSERWRASVGAVSGAKPAPPARG